MQREAVPETGRPLLVTAVTAQRSAYARPPLEASSPVPCVSEGVALHFEDGLSLRLTNPATRRQHTRYGSLHKVSLENNRVFPLSSVSDAPN